MTGTSISADANAAMNWLISPSEEVDRLWAELPNKQKTAMLFHKIAQFHASYQLNDPRADHLLSLTRINIYRAFVSNMVTLGITWDWMEEDSISPFSMARPGSELVLPDTLQPTDLQRRNPHHTWVDLFPCPVMRDNLVRAGNEWDDEKLCDDIMGF